MTVDRFKCPACGTHYPLWKILIRSNLKICARCGRLLHFTRRSEAILTVVGITAVAIAVLYWYITNQLFFFTAIWAGGIFWLCDGPLACFSARFDEAPSAEDKHVRRSHRVSNAIFNVMTVGMLLLCIWLIVAGLDIRPADLSDLLVERPSVSMDENAFTFFLKATETMRLPEDPEMIADFVQGDQADRAGMSDIIAANALTYDLLRRGSGKQVCRWPEQGCFDDPPGNKMWRNLGRLTALKSEYARQTGDYDTAVQYCLLLLRTGDMLRSDANSYLAYLYGASIFSQGRLQARRLARDPGISRQQLMRLSQELVNADRGSEAVVKALQGEYLSATRYIDRIKAGMFFIDNSPEDSGKSSRKMRFPGYLFKPEATRLLLAERYRIVIANLNRSYAEMDLDAVRDSDNMKGPSLWQMLAPNMFGRITMVILWAAGEHTLEQACLTQTETASTRLIMAVKAYERDHRPCRNHWNYSCQTIWTPYHATRLTVNHSAIRGRMSAFIPSARILRMTPAPHAFRPRQNHGWSLKTSCFS